MMPLIGKLFIRMSKTKNQWELEEIAFEDSKVEVERRDSLFDNKNDD